MSTNCIKSLQQQEPHLHNHQQKQILINSLNENLSTTLIQDWRCNDVAYWARQIECHSRNVVACLIEERIDGEVLMELCEDDVRDLRYRLNYRITVGELKKLWLSIRTLQDINNQCLKARNTDESIPNCGRYSNATFPKNCNAFHKLTPTREHVNFSNAPKHEKEHTYNATVRPDYGGSNGSSQQCIPPDIFKTVLSMGYSFVVTWITSFVMVIVHERVPDMKRYPPLPDIFLDNVPHIPWAFHMCEITGTLLFSIWACVCIFHKHRMVLLRRFFALAGTVFLLRCVTMLITSLSVPGTHLQCNQKDYAIDDTSTSFLDALHLRVTRAYAIWSGLGMSIQGVRTCGDYMFSGHTVALTLLNFFITEYTPRNLYFLHTLTWLLNMFGIFFILAAHEHYSIDVFVAFYITSRLFLYYHTLANNQQALMSRDSTRTRIWFPLFSYFESSVEGIVPNEYDTLGTLFDKIFYLIFSTIDGIIIRARNFWFESKKLGSCKNKSILFKFNNGTPLSTTAATPLLNSNSATATAAAAGAAMHNAGSYDELSTAVDELLQKDVDVTSKICSDDIKFVKKQL